MEQVLVYREVRYVIGPEQDGHRVWTVYDERDRTAETGFAAGGGSRGSFKAAVMAAREAIDARLDTSTAA